MWTFIVKKKDFFYLYSMKHPLILILKVYLEFAAYAAPLPVPPDAAASLHHGTTRP